MKINKLKLAKITLLVIAVGYLIAINVIPFLMPLRFEPFGWIVFVIYMLNLIFIWSLDKKKRTHFPDKERLTEDAKKSQALFQSRSRWFF